MERAEAVADFGEDVTAEEEADYHRFVVPDGCHWSGLRAATTNVGLRLLRILDRLEQANPDTRDAKVGRRSPSLLITSEHPTTRESPRLRPTRFP
jgi:hypothetical protein